MVHQECLLAQHLTVAENIFLGRQPAGPLGVVNRRSMEQQAARLIEQHNFPLQAGWVVRNLSRPKSSLSRSAGRFRRDPDC
jgi:ABC-type sugar transport system ATPase subunit